MATPRDIWLARRAKWAGAHYALRIVLEARRAGIPISLGFALIEKESNFRNVYGHDPVRSVRPRRPGMTDLAAKLTPVQGGPVTKVNYQVYKQRRQRGLGMQGVGPAQLTWHEYQDRADQRGGCWIPKHNIAVGFDVVAAHMRQSDGGVREAVRKYNGSGKAAENYAQDVMQRYVNWHNILKTR